MVLINPDKEAIKMLLKEIRSKSNSSETKIYRENKYGHNFATIHYYKNNVDIARIFKTDGVIDEIKIYEEE
jgi:hypothetical protein